MGLLTDVFEKPTGDLRHHDLCAGDIDFRRTSLAHGILSCGALSRAGRTHGNMS